METQPGLEVNIVDEIMQDVERENVETERRQQEERQMAGVAGQPDGSSGGNNSM